MFLKHSIIFSYLVVALNGQHCSAADCIRSGYDEADSDSEPSRANK